MLGKFAPKELENLRVEFPALVSELALGRIGGPGDASLDQDRAKVMVEALATLVRQADLEIRALRDRMSSARHQRLWSQVLSLICTSGVLGSLAIDQRAVAIVIAVLGLLASIGTLLAEYKERLLVTGQGDIYSIFESASAVSFKATSAKADLSLLIAHSVRDDELRAAVAAANALCDELHGLILKMIGSRRISRSEAQPPTG